MSLPDQEAAPQFVTVMRGYDRVQVDDYVEVLTNWADEGIERARLAELAAESHARECDEMRARIVELERALAEGPPRSVGQMAERVNMILAEAGRTAEAIRDAAEAEVAQVRQDAETARAEQRRMLEEARDQFERSRQSTETLRLEALGRAQAEAETLVEQARREGDAVLQRAQIEVAKLRDAAAAEVRQLGEAGQVVRGDLERLQLALDAALAGAGSSLPDGVIDLVDHRNNGWVEEPA